MKWSYLCIVAVIISRFGCIASGEESKSPTQSLKAFAQKVKQKKVDEFMARLYIPESARMPTLTAEMKNQILKQFSTEFACLLNGRIVAAKETDALAVVTAYEILPSNKPSADLKSIFLVKINDKWKISPVLFEPVPSNDMTEESFRKQVSLLKAWYETQCDAHSNKFCPRLMVTKKQIPFQKKLSLAPGNAVTVVLPDRKTLAVWCSKAGVLSLPGSSGLHLSYGEKAFKRLEIKWIPQSDGSRVAGPYKSYIRSGPVTTWSSGPGHEYILYVGDTYRVSLREEGDKNGELLPITLSVREATREEKVKPEDEVNYLVSQLKREDPAMRMRAIEKLQESLMLGCMYATPRWEYIVEQIRPLSRDPVPDVRKQADRTLLVLGDIGSIMKSIVPEPKGDALVPDTARRLGKFTKRSKDEKGKEKVYEHVKTFLGADSPELRAFAVSFFTYSDTLPEIRDDLVSAQEDSSAKVRKASVLAMEQVYPEREIPTHRIPMLNDESPEVVIMVMQSSVGYGSERELPISAVRRFINSNNKQVRLAAINAITFKDNRESEAILLPLTHHKDNDIKDAAICGLYGERSTTVYQRFLELLKDKDPNVRIRVLQGLYLDDYVQAIPYLEKHIQMEDDKDVLRVAKEALGKLRRLKAKNK